MNRHQGARRTPRAGAAAVATPRRDTISRGECPGWTTAAVPTSHEMDSATSVLGHPVGITASAAVTDVDAFIGQLYETQLERLTGFARMCIGDATAAEDLAHEVFLDLLGELRRDPDYLQSSPWAWLRSALVHRVINRRRQAFREIGRLMRVYERPREDDTPWSGEAIDFQRALSTLPPKMRACAVLRFVEDQTLEDIATAVGCGVRTVETQLERARERLGIALELLPDSPTTSRQKDTR